MATPVRLAAGLRLSGVSCGYGRRAALHDLSLEVMPGEFMVLLGPSGSGKSTLLGAVAGLLPVMQGQVMLGGRDVTRLEPADRDIALVFQSYALYPTMSVAQNITFGMRMRGVKRAERAAKLAEVAGLLRLQDVLRRKPAQLSGGQRQRVAIGRALVRDPQLFLFDEPLSNLDAQLRGETRVEIKRLQRLLGATTLYVTHDQVEAMTIADRIAVLHEGRILQVDAPRTLYDRPQNVFVARFVGAPGMNLIPARRIRRGAAVEAGGAILPLAAYEWSSAAGLDRPVLLGLRPEAIAPATGETSAMLTLTPTMIEPTGADLLVRLDLEGAEIAARFSRDAAVTLGAPLPVAFDLRNASVFAPDTGERL